MIGAAVVSSNRKWRHRGCRLILTYSLNHWTDLMRRTPRDRALALSVCVELEELDASIAGIGDVE